jgi:hypothetical protein
VSNYNQQSHQPLVGIRLADILGVEEEDILGVEEEEDILEVEAEVEARYLLLRRPFQQ